MRRFALFATLLALTINARADLIEAGDQLFVQTSLATRHFNPKPEHNEDQHLINVELVKANRQRLGLALFDNSFDQPCQYLYVGKSWSLANTRGLLSVKVTGGLIHGYKGEYKNKIPLNSLGVAPAILPSLVFNYKSFQSELLMFGSSGIIWSAGYNFDLGAMARD